MNRNSEITIDTHTAIFGALEAELTFRLIARRGKTAMHSDLMIRQIGTDFWTNEADAEIDLLNLFEDENHPTMINFREIEAWAAKTGY